ncbi:hypothetical protein EX895_002811 [Sporisorium graminicola]|uniref:Uncharacterized protein n=1 Tax=Sporisorium graminicola TaxID=280036 RepID=A0A4U7KU69_9BASI|nr:hypothetical protein EX895_002811 [Sporisorium graminicola]TKY88101.1 hypothetical protein EX895_002811 [Sporisorium graminicola]
MKYLALSMVSALALASLGSGVAARPLPQAQRPNAEQTPSAGNQSSQDGTAGGYGGSASATQNNDYSQVAPGNSVVNGGGQSASLQGLAGSVMQGSGVASLFQRRQQGQQQQASAGGYAGSSTAVQDTDDSNVAPGNSVQLGGSQSSSNQGFAGSVDQLSSFIARAVDSENSNSNDATYLANTKYGSPSSLDQQHPTACAQGSSEHCVPHYLGIGPEVRPAY